MSKVFMIASGMISTKKKENSYSRKHCYVNYGALRLASVLYESGFDTIVIQGLFNSPQETWERMISLGYEDEEFPILLSIPTFFSIPWARQFSRLIKKTNPSQKIIVGGQWVMNNRVDWIYSIIPEIDLVVCGMSDDSIVEIVSKNTLEYQMTQQGNLYFISNSKMPKSFLRYELLDEWHRFHPSIEISRGCGRGCSFCVERSIKLTYPLCPYLAIENFKYLRNLYNYELFYTYFQASNFCPSHKWALEFNRRYKENCLDSKWRTEIRVDTINPDTLVLLAESGLSVLDIGLESASKKQLRTMNKTTDPNSYLKKADILLKTASNLGILTKLNILLYPGESYDTIDETISWLSKRQSYITGVSVGSLILFGTENEIKSELEQYSNLKASIAQSKQEDPEGVYRMNLSNEINYEVAEIFSSNISNAFMSKDDYFALKSFCYFPRDYQYSHYKLDRVSDLLDTFTNKMHSSVSVEQTNIQVI